MGFLTRKNLALSLLLLAAPLFLIETSRTQTEPQVGIRENTPDVHALVNARIVLGPGRTLERGTLVIRDGVIEAVGARVQPPADARIWNYEGMTLYPGLIEPYSHLGMGSKNPPPPEDAGGPRAPSPEAGESGKADKGAHHWNPRVHPERRAADLYDPSSKDLEAMRRLGFTAALVVPADGVFRGSSALVSLRDGKPNEVILEEAVAQHLAFERARWPARTYPGSLMGAIALIRQTFLDASWYYDAHQAYRRSPGGQEPPEVNEALAALEASVHGKMPVVFEAGDELDVLRAAKIGEEFGLEFWIRGSGDEYRRLDLIAGTGATLIVPVAFPEAPAVEDPEEALGVTLAALSRWEAAPENPARLAKAGVPFVLTSDLIEKRRDFPGRVERAIERGLSRDDALAALTVRPARLFGVQDRLGTLERGKLAHIVVVDGDLFDEEAEVRDVWIDGLRYEIEPVPEADPAGTWKVALELPEGGRSEWDASIEGKPASLRATLSRGETEVEATKLALERKRLVMLLPGDELGFEGTIRLVGTVEKERLAGEGVLPDGTWFAWTAERFEKAEEPGEEAGKAGGDETEEAAAEAPEAAPPPVYPPGAYGRLAPPEQPEHLLVRNATIWTSGPKGRLERADLLVRAGKIVAVGPDLDAPPTALVIDAKGKHVTPGLIDCHSHTGISAGVNEGTQAVTAEVRIADVINSDDIGFYRELAGGLTTINQLHGSANPIGGQNSVIKLRWGAPPEALRIEDAIPGIKFALGENVKQSNWGDNFRTRYPQTRMGVEQIIRDRLQAAVEYQQTWEEYRENRTKGLVPPRRDLELETLAEVLNGERIVHCHSYRQDEILMLVRVAEDFGFTIGVFQHVLEGYKVADVLARHGAGASTFSDWWAYKFEVYDAIPYNGTLMHDAGVVVSFNSDSGELARRLNTEAAKAVKYGGLSEEEALDLVTLNPARQLRIDHRVGSLEVDKDADFVIWSADPLSTYAVCEQTWIQGRKYFDRALDRELRERVVAERERIIQKILASAEKGKKGPGKEAKGEAHWSCTEGGER